MILKKNLGLHSGIKQSVKYHTKIKTAGEAELGMQLRDEVWEHAISRIRSATSCARLGLIQFKVLRRMHFSKSRLSEIYSDVEDNCHGSTLSPWPHAFSLPGVWTSYFSIRSTVLGVSLQACPLICPFGIPDASLPLKSM